MEDLQSEPDLSWMSFNPEAHGIKPRFSVLPGFGNSSSGERDGGVGGWSRRSGSSGVDKSGESRSRYEWREKEVKEPDGGEQWPYRRKEQESKVVEPSGGVKFLREPSGGVKFLREPSGGVKFLRNGLKDGFGEDRAPRNGVAKRWAERLDTEEDEVEAEAQSMHPRVKFARRVACCGFLVAVVVATFLLYISFGATARAPQACAADKVVLNYTAQRIRLSGGRHVSFREQGVPASRARHTMLVLHDLVSSRLAGIPGISNSLLEEFRVRLVTYDRPGYGQSDAHPGRTYSSSAQDISDIADALNLGEKFWLAGFGTGGAHVWAAIKHIPDRLAGVTLFAPAGSFYARNMSRDDIDQTWGALSLRQKWMYYVARHFPAVLPSLMQKALIEDPLSPSQYLGASLGSKDQEWMNERDVLRFWNQDVAEALNQRCAFPMTEELILLVDDWGFNLARLPFNFQTSKSFLQQVVRLFQAQEQPRLFSGPIHIWQGTEDRIVPPAINTYAKRMVELNAFPEDVESPVRVHTLEGEGHWSWFWFCGECHRSILTTLFGSGRDGMQFPASHRGFSEDAFGALLEAFGGPQEVADRISKKSGSSQRSESFLRHHSKQAVKVSVLDAKDAQDKDDGHSKGMMVYIPETCQAPMDVTNYVFRIIEEGIKKFIR